MSDDIQDEAERTFRPGRRPAWIAIALNASLLLAALGVPYVRGRMRANEAAERFSRFAHCMYGGRITSDPGLAMPPGDREHFAAQVERAPAEWPGTCSAILREMRPEPAIFLFPSPKQAEEDLRRALDLTEGELEALGRAREGGDIGAVPERPLRAIGHLRAALANLLQASDATVDPTQHTLEWDADATIVAPSRIPLLTAAGGATLARIEPGGLRVMSSDGRTLSEVVVHEGSVEQAHEHRPSSARGLAMGPEGGFVLWITSESTCATDPGRCASRLLGLGTVVEGEGEPEPTWWLAAHPAGRPDRAVRIETDRARVIAVAEGGTEARTFPRGAPAAPAAEGEVAPIAATETLVLGETIDALLTDRGVATIVRGTSDDVIVTGLPGLPPSLGEPPDPAAAALEDDRTSIPLSDLGGAVRAGHAALFACGDRVAIATPEAIAIVGARDEVARVTAPLREPLLGATRSDDAVRLVCRVDGGVDLVAIDRQRVLRRWSCGATSCTEPQVVARGVAQMDAAHAAGTTLLAWTGDTTHPQIRVSRVHGSVIGGAEVPAPCWDGEAGMCGAPFVLAEGDHLMIAAREESDLLVLSAVEGGFARLPGL